MPYQKILKRRCIIIWILALSVGLLSASEVSSGVIPRPDDDGTEPTMVLLDESDSARDRTAEAISEKRRAYLNSNGDDAGLTSQGPGAVTLGDPDISNIQKEIDDMQRSRESFLVRFTARLRGLLSSGNPAEARQLVSVIKRIRNAYNDRIADLKKRLDEMRADAADPIKRIRRGLPGITVVSEDESTVYGLLVKGSYITVYEASVEDEAIAALYELDLQHHTITARANGVIEAVSAEDDAARYVELLNKMKEYITANIQTNTDETADLEIIKGAISSITDEIDNYTRKVIMAQKIEVLSRGLPGITVVSEDESTVYGLLVKDNRIVIFEASVEDESITSVCYIDLSQHAVSTRANGVIEAVSAEDDAARYVELLNKMKEYIKENLLANADETADATLIENTIEMIEDEIRQIEISNTGYGTRIIRR